MDKTFLNKLTTLVTPAAGNQFDIADVERRPRGMATELFQKGLARAGGILSDEKKPLKKCEEQFQTVETEIEKFSHDQALARFRDQLDRAIQGERITPESKLEAIGKNSQSRSVLKHRLDLISAEAKLIVRPIYERVISALVEMAAELEAEERSYSGNDFRPSYRLLQHRVAVTTLSRYITELEKPNRIRPAHLLFTDKI